MYRRIKDLREDMDLTQKTIANYLNMSQNGYSQYETDTNKIPVEVLKKLAIYYNTSIDYLVELTDEKNLIKEKNSKNQFFSTIFNINTSKNGRETIKFKFNFNFTIF